MDAASSIYREIVVDADPATVFAFFTDPERLIRWMGVSANLDPKPGGLLLIDVVDGFVAQGEFKEVVPVSRLAYTWAWEGNKENVPPGSSLVYLRKTAARSFASTIAACLPKRYPDTRMAGSTILGDWRWWRAGPIRALILG